MILTQLARIAREGIHKHLEILFDQEPRSSNPEAIEGVGEYPTVEFYSSILQGNEERLFHVVITDESRRKE